MNIRSEYPRPSFVRENWTNLNGTWEFYMDMGASGADRKVYEAEKFDSTIVVPFCPESKLSGIGNVDFMPSVWYGRNIDVTQKQLQGRVLLHVGACDYHTEAYVNGKSVGTHDGGYTSFSFDITDYLKAGGNRLVIHALDDPRSNRQPVGKQSREYYSHACDYTRTTGIWQTVWLEFVPETYIAKVKINATDLGGTVFIETTLNRYRADAKLRAEVTFQGKPVCTQEFDLCGVVSQHALTVSPVRTWSPASPDLYDVRYTLLVGGKAIDTAVGYFGIRRIDIDGYKVLLNGKPVFQRLILDQGFYPDGIYTAPSDEALKRDIELSMRLGFNGARLHEKVFEERYLYHADKMGYLVWGEFPDWGCDVSAPENLHTMLPQWLESVERDFNHPSIIGWCPHNETWDFQNRRQINTNLTLLYRATKAADPTRPVIDTSGLYHTAETDIFDIHDYQQKPEVFGKHMAEHAAGKFHTPYGERLPYDGKKPFMVSEYGGIKWSAQFENTTDSWGYGDSPKTPEEFCDRYCGLTTAILGAANIFGFCYTQLTDVEQEQNGLYYYDRSPKFSDTLYEKIRKANTTVAAIEK